ncbi:MAG: non-hydrolyzing UDP-N-acetylglucosamine 2-epimerase, partial [Planctomycetota bacterium]
ALKQSATLQPVLLSTGQHREMLAQALAAFDLTPDADLALMQPGQTLPELTGRVINAVTEFIQANRPDAILVQGDTTTVLAASIAATYARVPVGHVEAGLRTYDMDHPFPEEMNRRLVSPLARWSFVPTATSRQNLLQEHIAPETSHITGNSVIDALLWMREKVQGKQTSPQALAERLGIPAAFANKDLDPSTSGEQPARWILVTGHRRESFGDGFESICQALRQLVEEHSDVGILYPVHLNPNVREPVNRLLSNHPRIALIEPVGYEDFIWLMDRCHFLLSDSGGVQEEAPSLGKPVLVMRTTTERPEGVEAGTCRLVGTDPAAILREASLLLNDRNEYQHRSALKNPYGDGQTAVRIREILEKDLNI